MQPQQCGDAAEAPAPEVRLIEATALAEEVQNTWAAEGVSPRNTSCISTMTNAYSNIADSVVEQLSGEGWTTGDIERLNKQAADRGSTVSFVCQSADEAAI